MAALPQPAPFLTSEEYLAFERQSNTRHEYYRGEIFALAGATRTHNLITFNLAGVLSPQLKHRPCEAYVSNMRVKIADGELYAYPDAVVVCGKAEFEDCDKDTLLNPTVIIEVLSPSIEVLSPSTETYARGAQFELYRTLESLSDYLLVSQSKPMIEHYTRQADDRWLLMTYKGLDAVAAITSIGCELRLADVYDKVEWPAGEEALPRLRRVKETGAGYETR